MNVKVKVKMKPVAQIIKDHGLDRDGDVQKQWTNMVWRRMPRYMPFRSGVLAEKQFRITSPTTIEAMTKYAHFQYAGKVWIDPITGSTLAPKYGKKVPTFRNLQYDTTAKHDRAGPLWDKRLIAAEGDAMLEDMRTYIRDREKGKG